MSTEPIPPSAAVMQMVMGAWTSQTISAVTRLDVPDHLRNGPLSARELVARHGVDAKPESLERALRACASVGIFTESADGRFGPTPLSEVLTLDAPGSVKKLVEMMGASWWKVWSGLLDAIRTGEPQSKAQLGLPYWDYCNANPKEMEAFGEAMKANSQNSLRGILEHCDFSNVGTVADVGGGFGHLAIALLEKYPRLEAVVFDVPDLKPIAEARAAKDAKSVLSRLSFQGGDMFAGVPPADAYVMKHIIHDWDDERCAKLLSHCRAAMRGDGRVYCVDAVVPPMGDTSGAPAKLLDLDMMVVITGKERTEKEWRALYAVAGLEVTSITPIRDNFGTSIVAGRK